MPAPIAFISSTSDDLKQHREQAARAAQASGFFPLMMEYFPSDGSQPSLDVCLSHVARAEVAIVLVAHRYGWVPEGSSNPDAKSITWLECEHACRVRKIEVLAFLVHPDHHWPPDLRENYRLVTEQAKRGIRKEVNRNETKLGQFKAELNRFVRGTFTDATSVRALVSESLSAWKERHPSIETTNSDNTDNYLENLEDENRLIRIKGLRSRRAEPYSFGIDEIYISLTTLTSGEKQGHKPTTALTEPQGRTALERALSERKLVLLGEPGSGKSTFLRRVAFELCRNLRGTRTADTPLFLGERDKRFPILIRAADLAKRLADPDRPAKPDDSPDWIPWFLGRQNAEYKWGLNEAFFRQRLEREGNCLLMVDGLDETPDRRVRERISRIFEKATRAFSRCGFLVTTRDQTYWGDAVLTGFQTLRIGNLEMTEMRTFFRHFAKALALTEAESKTFNDALEDAVNHRIEIREMARNPVMLTALAVLQHNGQRLPEHRVDLYDEILRWLAAAREGKPGRPPADKCLEFLRRIALVMQDQTGGRVVQINKRSAAELSQRMLGGTVEQNELLLENETEDSGILSPVGRTDLKFWHLSFQEYLAAREIASLTETEQIERVVTSGKLYKAEWREMMRLLGGVLRQQGEAKIEGLFQAILSARGSSLPEQARCAGLLGSMMRDLSGMGYKPETPDYPAVLQSLDRIFVAAEAATLDLKTRIEAAEALGNIGDPRLEADNRITISAGTYWMGAQRKKPTGQNYDPEARDDESPVHEVKLRAYRIGRFPVTVQEFAAFLENGGYRARDHWAEGGFGQFEQPDRWEEQGPHLNRPVTGVSWYEAAAYCAWAGGRLPTEAEWERSARGPNSSGYPWGNEPGLDPSRANYNFSGSPGAPAPVGVFPAGHSSEGLSDLLGNVWEWCSDWYGGYSDKKHEDPAGPPSGRSRIVRGGSWSNNPRNVRASYRNYDGPSVRYYYIGFRCAGELA
ncbi:MAG: SUMF1/EgtB/PvdO family nonheme iron enzyme [Bryobacteraceae bacterium]|nr:SUMF1/EgtB/PvdO family nonheme iron enzyme [Bryobacteraceae bacterium]